MSDLGVRTLGQRADGETVLLTGTYLLDGEVSRRLLRALPDAARAARRGLGLPAGPVDGRRDRQGRARPGGGARPPARPAADRRAARLVRATGGRRAGLVSRLGDPVVGRRCACCTTTPRTPGRSPSSPRATGVSRAALARRFNELVGEPPMSFLTGWRIALAADLLREPGATVGSVAHQVGYGSPFALSAAFKRVRGISPQQHRAGAVASPAERAGRTVRRGAGPAARRSLARAADNDRMAAIPRPVLALVAVILLGAAMWLTDPAPRAGRASATRRSPRPGRSRRRTDASAGVGRGRPAAAAAPRRRPTAEPQRPVAARRRLAARRRVVAQQLGQADELVAARGAAPGRACAPPRASSGAPRARRAAARSRRAAPPFSAVSTIWLGRFAPSSRAGRCSTAPSASARRAGSRACARRTSRTAGETAARRGG